MKYQYYTFSTFADDLNRHPHEKMKRLWFDLSSAPVEDTAIGTELRLFRDSGEYGLSYEYDITVTVFQVIKNLKGLVFE